MYDKKYNHCIFWFMSAELKNALVAAKGLWGDYGTINACCNIYKTTRAIEVVLDVVYRDGLEAQIKVIQHFTSLSFWWYRMIYAVPAAIRWGNIITREKMPNLICKLRGWK